MPIPGTHTARQFSPDSCDTIRQKAITDGVTALVCVAKGNGAAKIQSIHFDAKAFTAEEARKWLKDHDFSAENFEPATKDAKAAAAPTGDMQDVSQCPMAGDCPLRNGEYAAAAACGGVRVVNLAAERLPSSLNLTSADLEIQAAAPANGVNRRAFAATSYTGVGMRIDGFAHPVVVDLAGMRIPSQKMPVLRQHDPERPVGHTTTAETSAQRLRNAGFLHDITAAGKEALALIDAEFPWQVSLGADVQKMEFVDKGASAKANGRNFEGPVYVARATTLREISLVPMGADPGTSAALAGSGGAGTGTFRR